MTTQTDILDSQAREIIENRLRRGMIGPGSDNWGLPDEVEIIANDYPLIRYFSGVLFPTKSRVATQDSADLSDSESQAITDADEDEENPIETSTIKEVDAALLDSPKSDEPETTISQNNFFPTNMGASVALETTVTSIDVTFSFGLYSQVRGQKNIKIPITENGFKSFFNEKIPYQLPFKEALKYEDGMMFIDRELSGNKGGRGQSRSGEYKQFDEFRKRSNLIDTEAYYCIEYLEKLLGRVWQRENFVIPLKIPTVTTERIIPISFSPMNNKKAKVGYNVKLYESDKVKHIKVQLVNISDEHPANRFSNKSEPLNEKSIFQSSIKISSNGIVLYKDNAINTYFTDDDVRDKEAEEIEFIYRNIKSYGVGHNCSVKWSEDHKSIETTFFPKQDIKDVINEFEDNKLDDSLNIKNLSVWGLPKDKIIANLIEFSDSYKEWINGQISESKKFENNELDIAQSIINRLTETHSRLQKNIELLKDDNSFRAFQIANTAMLLQIIISNDKDFCKTEKEINEISQTVDFKNLTFFENYQYEQRLGFIPKFRPFQLAFFLLSIDEIVHPEVRKLKNTVDLIWFPTGGGKTEAYLAVTAFSIAFRRLSNPLNFEGTSVIMRYTLRLLTAQQFERASRLISALEFLRNQKEFEKDLKSGKGNEITIGLWVGQSSTPNTLNEAAKLLDGEKYGMEAEAQKGANGDPAKYNEFQISSCPWCGTKSISKETDYIGNVIWKYGFKSKRNDFIIHCLNKACFFHERLPIQVVDEILYNNPPSLLFGTVDKFAMLAWQSEAHNFFKANVKDGLPPDLIIQDELHLLSGPLGSVTGLFESTIELLCSKNGIGPKIISSTATTRNTNLQIKKLYGNRKVNVFPPSGLEFNDSFFARENQQSKRRYIGFMPTGKTAIDTQLQIIAHLLVARLEVFINNKTKERTDSFWTIVSYYNSLKGVGKIYNKVGDEITNFTSTLQYRLSQLFQPFEKYSFNYFGIPNRTEELTSRVESSKIKAVLKDIERPFSEKKITESGKGYRNLTDVVDLILATNMISVGIDISRLNIMLLNGMPKNIAEYIQASSRVGRKTKGLVISLLDPNRAREKSYFEHFINFHQAFYKSVEPISITPFTENTIDKMLTTAFVSYIRNKIPGMASDDSAKLFTRDYASDFKTFMLERLQEDLEVQEYFTNKLSTLIDSWESRANLGSKLTYKTLLKRPTEKQQDGSEWATMQSMREIDTDTFVEIKSIY